MKMKTKQLLFPVVVVVVVMVTTTTTAYPTTTPGYPAQDLNGKMFTLSLYRGGITFFPPYYSSPSSTRGYYTTPSPWTSAYPTTYPTAYPTRGVSVCLRYVTDFDGGMSGSISLFTLSPSTNPLRLTLSSAGLYSLAFNGYNSIYLKPSIQIWPSNGQSIWTSVCVTVDSAKNVAQVFSGSNMSPRKLIPSKYVWSGEPVIDLAGFTGQVTDIQVWDYPLRYKEVFYYLSPGFFGPNPGSVLTWSNIRFSLRGETLMEDRYEVQAKEPGERGERRLNRKRTTLMFSSVKQSDKGIKEVV